VELVNQSCCPRQTPAAKSRSHGRPPPLRADWSATRGVGGVRGHVRVQRSRSPAPELHGSAASVYKPRVMAQDPRRGAPVPEGRAGADHRHLGAQGPYIATLEAFASAVSDHPRCRDSPVSRRAPTRPAGKNHISL